MRLCGLVAAAGESRRMGFPKALLTPHTPGAPPHALAWALALTAAGAHPVWVTLPPQGKVPHPADRQLMEQLRGRLEAAGALPLDNEHWEQGLIGSVWTALSRVQDRALIMVPVDVPLSASAPLHLLIRAATPDRPAALCHRGTRGHPVLLPPSIHPRVLAHRGDGGLREALAPLTWTLVEAGVASVCQSLDTPAQAAASDPPLGRWAGESP